MGLSQAASSAILDELLGGATETTWAPHVTGHLDQAELLDGTTSLRQPVSFGSAGVSGSVATVQMTAPAAIGTYTDSWSLASVDRDALYSAQSGGILLAIRDPQNPPQLGALRLGTSFTITSFRVSLQPGPDTTIDPSYLASILDWQFGGGTKPAPLRYLTLALDDAPLSYAEVDLASLWDPVELVSDVGDLRTSGAQISAPFVEITSAATTAESYNRYHIATSPGGPAVAIGTITTEAIQVGEPVRVTPTIALTGLI